MKISILLPYKENYSPTYPGAVSLFIKQTLKYSKYKKFIKIFGSTNFKKKLSKNYHNLKIGKKFILSKNNEYINEFIKVEEKEKSNLIEIHNRPKYIFKIYNHFKKPNIFFYFHNDPLSMKGSSTVDERKKILNYCKKIFFNSNWSKNRFLDGIEIKNFEKEKLIISYQSAEHRKINLAKKQKIITFIGKLNRSKGYDLFGKAVLKILNKYPDWKSIVIGDEPRDKIFFQHKNFKNLGFAKYDKVLSVLKKTSISVISSRWEEPFGRTSLESAAMGCAVIISNRGGLPETITNGIILKKLNSDEIFKQIDKLIKNRKKRILYQKKSHKNFFLTHKYVTKIIDNERNDFITNLRNFHLTGIKNLKIIHVTNFNQRFEGRLFYNTGKRINNGFIKLGHSVLEISDRDITHYNKSITDFDGKKNLNNFLYNTYSNYKPDLIILGHADKISNHTLNKIRAENPNIKIAQWFLDPLIVNGPDYKKNQSRFLDKYEVCDANFLTTYPKAINFLKNRNSCYFIPNPADSSMEVLNNSSKNCKNDIFFALSHGVHRGTLKSGKTDERVEVLKKIMRNKDIKYDFYGIENIQPIWAENFIKRISNSKMGLNLSRGKPTKYYSSDRIAQFVGNGLVTFIHKDTKYEDFFSKDEMVFYKNTDDLIKKILSIKKNDNLRKKIARKGKYKYLKYFNSKLVADYILKKTFNLKYKNKFKWEIKS